MKKKLLLMLAVVSTCFALPQTEFLQQKEIISNDVHPCGQVASLSPNASILEDSGTNYGVLCKLHSTENRSITIQANNLTLQPSILDEITSIVYPGYTYPKTITLNEIKEMLRAQGATLNTSVINKVLTTLKCANAFKIDHNNILTIIDYSLPSSDKRLWVFDLKEKKLLFNTYVSHGIKTGVLLSNNFSNKYNSKSSSMGVYKTDEVYYGRHGLSLKLDGLDSGFNDNAANRSVVMHGGWYVDERFIKKYGRAGRSWGCPALPDNLTESIINTIKDRSIFVAYYPSDDWFAKSRFLRCDHTSTTPNVAQMQTAIKPPVDESDVRDDILFADLNKDNKHTENEPVVVVTADNYVRIFHTKAPLGRMLRRQINNAEYIALSKPEFENISSNPDNLSTVYFVIPEIKMVRGYYATEMKIVNFGKIKDASINADSSQTKSFTVHCEQKPSISLRSTNQFIRWLGL